MRDQPTTRRQQLSARNSSRLLQMPYQAFIGRLFASLAEAGYGDIHPSHAIVFQHLPAEGSRVTDLAEQTQLTKQYIGRLVAELEERGYLEQAPDPADGRAKQVRLSTRGREVTRVAEGIIADIEADWSERLGASEYAALRRSLVKLILSLEA
jgi:DNA-binding MarR family transcriptional regulator